jgi:hypothetical protein
MFWLEIGRKIGQEVYINTGQVMEEKAAICVHSSFPEVRDSTIGYDSGIFSMCLNDEDLS